MQTDLARLANEKYVLLTTFRKDGRAVPTPVWAARDGDKLLVRTLESGKVKRIRRDGAVEVSPCDFRGRPRGKAVTGQARLLNSAEIPLANAAIINKYGLVARLVSVAARLRRGKDAFVGIAISLNWYRALSPQ